MELQKQTKAPAPAQKGVMPRALLKWISVAWLALTLVPLVAIAFYAHPVHDDFPHIFDTAATWAGTGDLFKTLAAAWGRMVDMYNTWQGTFIAMLNSALQPMVFSPRLYFLTPLMTLAALYLSSAYLVKEAAYRTLKADGSAATAVYAAFMTMLIQFLPSIREVVYWQSGIPYTLSLAALFIMLGLMLKLRREQPLAVRLWRYAALLACGVVLGGCPYPLALGGTVIMLLLTALCAAKRSRALTGSIIGFLSTALSLVVVVLAPGNGVRQQIVGTPMSAPAAIVMGLAKCVEQSGKWVSPQLIAYMIILYLILNKPLRESGMSFKYPLLVTVLSFGALGASFVPPIYAMGIEGYKVERVLSSLYMLFVLLASVNIVYWVGWFGGRGVAEAATKHGRVYACERAAYALCAALIVWGFFAQGIFATPSISAARSLINGEARIYDQEMTAREQAITQAKSDKEAASVIKPLSVSITVLPYDMLPHQTSTTMPSLMRRYYRLASLTEQYGAGGIPAELFKIWGNAGDAR